MSSHRPIVSGVRRQASGVRRQVSGVKRQASGVRQFTIALLAIAFSSLEGCAESRSGYERYVPSVAGAEEALNQVLSAWKRGESAGPLECHSAPVTIQVADSTRRPGQRLVEYELLGEIAGEGPRTFAVRLKLENPNAVREVRYYLVGIDPLWVFRQEDYEAIVHWQACVPD